MPLNLTVAFLALGDVKLGFGSLESALGVEAPLPMPRLGECAPHDR